MTKTKIVKGKMMMIQNITELIQFDGDVEDNFTT
jgi:hypothetical protein